MTQQLSKKLYRGLTDDGTETGDTDMNVDGSVTPQEFYIQPPPGEKYCIGRMLIEYQDGGTWSSGTFGSIATLANGLSIKVLGGDTDELLDITAVHAIKQNADWAGHCYDFEVVEGFGAGDDVGHARWSLFKDDPSSDGIVLSGHRKERLVFTINDDLTDLTDFHVYIRGFKL